MLVTIRNLPASTRYADLKSLIVSKCGFNEMILDNLTSDGYNSKKVTVGLAEEEDAAIVMRKINGLIIDGHQIFVETVKKKQGPPFQPDIPPQPTLQQPYYQQSNYQPPSYQQGLNDFQQNVVPTAAYAELYNPANVQNAFANYGYPQQMQYQSNQMVAQSVPTFSQDAPLGFSNQGANVNVWAHQNDWNPAGNASGGNNASQQNRINTRWDNSDDNIDRPRRDAPARERGRGNVGSSLNYGQHAASRDVGRRGASRDFGRDAQSRGNGRDAQSRGNGRDAPSRDRGRDAPRDHRRDASHRDRRDDRDRDRNASGRFAPHSRSDSDRGPSKRQFSANNAPGKSSAQMNKFSQQRDKPGQNLKTPQSKPSPNMNRKESSYVPPAKRQRTNAESFNQHDKQDSANNDQVQTKKKIKKNDPVTLHNRASTWRCQLASAIAKDILKNPELKNDIEGFLNELKHAIRDRLELLFGDNVNVTQEYMLKVYRQKFSVDTDADFFQEVTEYVKKHGTIVDKIKKATMADLNIGAAVEKTPSTQQGGKPTNQTGGVKQGAKPKIQQAGVKQGGAEKENADGFKIPSYPQGDKKLSKEMKKQNQMIFKDTEPLISQLHPNLKKALDEEVEKMGAMIAEEFQEEPDPQYKNLHKCIKTIVIDYYKQMMKVNVAKRILNMGPIMIRIFITPMISRGVLAPILATYGIDSLRKSDNKKTNMYIGSCKSYEIHDKLCAMEPILVEGSKVSIRPFQLTGTNGKVTRQQIKTQRQHIAEAYSDSSAGMAEHNEDDDVENNLNIDDQQDGEQYDDDQLEEEAGETIDNVNNGDTKEPKDEETQETGEYDNAEMADGNNEEEDSELDKENEQVEAPIGVKNDNLTTDNDVNKESQNNDNPNGKSSEIDNADQEKDLSNNLEDADDEPKDYEDIDMDNLNDDDLEDW